MVSVVTTGFGQAALETLGRLLDDRRSRDPLAPALVVCARPLLAVGTRRALGRRPGGIAGVDVVTNEQLIDDLALDALAISGARIATDLEVQAAIRTELAANPGRFGRVADHRTTEERLLALHHQLVGLGDAGLARLQEPADGLAADAVRVLRSLGRRLGDAVSRDDAGELALHELERQPSGSWGPIVVFLPEPTRPLDGQLVQALAQRDDCDVVVGLTGDRAIDRRHLSRLAAWSVQVEGSSSVPVEQASVLEVADPDDEVSAALRTVTAHAATGVPLSRMAVLYSDADPYATLLREQLDRAGLDHCGPSHRTLATSLTGRLLLRLLDLRAGDLDRASVITLVSSGPILHDGEPVPARAWDQLSRQAGVIDGDHWEPRIDELSAYLDGQALDDARALASFVGRLRRRLLPAAEPDRWTAWASWARALLADYLLRSHTWPADELAAGQAIERLLDQIARLDRSGDSSTVDFAAFTSIVSTHLARSFAPGRPLGTGLLVAPIAAAAGLDLDRVVIVGLAEGLYPRNPREDSLLPDKLRAETRGKLAPTDTVTDLDTRAVAAALAGSRHQPLAITARGDLRSIRSRSWPRELDSLVAETNSLVSHHQSLADHGRPISLADAGLRSLIAHVDGGDPVHTHDLAGRDPALRRNLARIRARARGELNPHIGRVAAGTIDATERLLSATALEAYASCPRSYLFGRVLRLGADDPPERIDEVTPADRGTLVHAILERFVGDSLAADLVPAPDEPWSDERRDHLFMVLDTEVADAQARGVTGGRVATMILRRRLGIEMDLFLATDNALRAGRRSTPIDVEIGFGIEDAPSDVQLPDGRSLRLRGRVDRVDATEDGGVLVIDYKGGSGRAFAAMDDNPLDGGRRLQLPLYARVVADRLDRRGPRTALYWLTRHVEVKPMELEDELESELDATVAAALDGISAGLFPGVPGEAVGWPRLTFANCKYCEFDKICPTDRQREWESVRRDPALETVELLLSEPADL